MICAVNPRIPITLAPTLNGSDMIRARTVSEWFLEMLSALFRNVVKKSNRRVEISSRLKLTVGCVVKLRSDGMLDLVRRSFTARKCAVIKYRSAANRLSIREKALFIIAKPVSGDVISSPKSFETARLIVPQAFFNASDRGPKSDQIQCPPKEAAND